MKYFLRGTLHKLPDWSWSRLCWEVTIFSLYLFFHPQRGRKGETRLIEARPEMVTVQECQMWIKLLGGSKSNSSSSIIRGLKLGSGCSTAVEHTPHDGEVMGSNPGG